MSGGKKALFKLTENLCFPAPEGEIIFPLARVRGNRPGPRVVISAGIHGCEYSAIAAAIALYQELDPAKLQGSVDIVTIASLKSFESRTPFVCPVDGKNPNRVFPGSLDGSYTDIMVWRLLNEVIRGADYYLDLHGGDMVEMIEPFSLYHVGCDPEVMERSRQMAVCYGLPNLVATGDATDWPDYYTTYANGAKLGVASIIAECGGVGQMKEEDIATHLRGLRNVLRFVGSMPGAVENYGPVAVYNDFVWLYSPVAGFCRHSVCVGDEVEQGQKVGQVEDYFGNQKQELIAPATGRILFITTSPAMPENGIVLAIGRR